MSWALSVETPYFPGKPGVSPVLFYASHCLDTGQRSFLALSGRIRAVQLPQPQVSVKRAFAVHLTRMFDGNYSRCSLLNCYMSVLLANIGGPDPLWVLTAAAVILSAVLALGALIPAVLGHLRSTLLVAAPASIAGLSTTVLLTYFFSSSPDGAHRFGDFIRGWVIWAGIPLATSFLAISLAWLRSRTKKRLINDAP